MMSSKAISAAIRAKKKMKDEDATDILQGQHDEVGDQLSKDMPAAQGEGQGPHEMSAPDPHVAGEDEETKLQRKAKIMNMMSRMGK